MENLIASIASNIIAAILIFLFGYFCRDVPRIIRGALTRSMVRRRTEQALPSYTSKWLVLYYLDLDRADDLYSLILGESHRYLPFLTHPRWHDAAFWAGSFDIGRPVDDSSRTVDSGLVESRRSYAKSLGADIWNGHLVCAASVEPTAEGPRVHVQGATYYQYLSACGSLEDETYAAIQRPGRRTTLRDTHARNLNMLCRCGLKAHGVGMQVCLVWRHGDSHRILVQRRVKGLPIYGGALAVIPNLTCEPCDLPSGESVLFHNFLREFYEELYNAPEVTRPSNHVDPRWFYEEEPVRELLEERRQERFVFQVLGIGFEALNGELNVAAVAYFADASFIRRQVRKFVTNSEVARICDVDLDSEELKSQLVGYEFQPGSAFAISKTRDWLRSR